MIIQGNTTDRGDFIIEQEEIYLHLSHEIKSLLAICGQQSIVKHFILNGCTQKRSNTVILLNNQDAFACKLLAHVAPSLERKQSIFPHSPSNTLLLCRYPQTKYNR